MCISSPETNSWSVIYRKNSGEDINITSLTFKNSLLAARILMVPENYMICILRNGERVRRWDREIRKRLVRTVLIFTESSDQLSRATDRVPGLPASPGYVQ